MSLALANAFELCADRTVSKSLTVSGTLDHFGNAMNVSGFVFLGPFPDGVDRFRKWVFHHPSASVIRLGGIGVGAVAAGACPLS